MFITPILHTIDFYDQDLDYLVETKIISKNFGSKIRDVARRFIIFIVQLKPLARV
jgi:hypothetical protein